MKRSELKANAREQLRDNWLWAVGSCLVSTIMVSLTSSFNIGVLGGMVLYGVIYTFLALADGKEIENILSAMFSGFTSRKFLPILLTSLLVGILISLRAIPLITPGTVKEYFYSMASYTAKGLAEADKDIAPTEATNKSCKLMDGHKVELFLLDLSSTGWAILATIPLGSGWLWLMLYYQATKANHYRQLAGDQFKKIIET